MSSKRIHQQSCTTGTLRPMLTDQKNKFWSLLSTQVLHETYHVDIHRIYRWYMDDLRLIQIVYRSCMKHIMTAYAGSIDDLWMNVNLPRWAVDASTSNHLQQQGPWGHCWPTRKTSVDLCFVHRSCTKRIMTTYTGSIDDLWMIYGWSRSWSVGRVKLSTVNCKSITISSRRINQQSCRTGALGQCWPTRKTMSECAGCMALQ